MSRPRGRPKVVPHKMRKPSEHRAYTSDILVAEYPEGSNTWWCWLMELRSGCVVQFAGRYFVAIRFEASSEEEARKAASFWWGLSKVHKLPIPEAMPAITEVPYDEHIALFQGKPKAEYQAIVSKRYWAKKVCKTRDGEQQARPSMPTLREYDPKDPRPGRRERDWHAINQNRKEKQREYARNRRARLAAQAAEAQADPTSSET